MCFGAARAVGQFSKHFFPHLLLCAVLLTGSVSCTSPVSTDDWWDHYEPGHAKEEIEKDFNLHRGKWWNYYTRGRWFAEGGHWEAAEEDFRKALSKRSKDQRHARSYGMHFWDYFPRRELGVAYFNQKKYEQAIEELTTSLQSFESAKAKFYLNKARQAQIQSGNLDRQSPTLAITSHRNGQHVNSRIITLAGLAKDDQYVERIQVNDHRLFVELAQQDLSFSEKVALKAGANTITVRATDLAGKEATVSLRLVLDMASPIICLDQAREVVAAGGRRVRVRGVVTDNEGVTGLWLNHKELRVPPGREVAVDQEVVIPAGKDLAILAADAAGNETQGVVAVAAAALPAEAARPLSQLVRWFPEPAPVRLDTSPPLANASPHGALGAEVAGVPRLWLAPLLSVVGAGGRGPRISLRCSDSPVTDQEDFYLDGDARDSDGVKSLVVNGEAIKTRNSKQVIFSQVVAVKEGENRVVVEATDTKGNVARKDIAVTMRLPPDLLSEERLAAALMPIRNYGATRYTRDKLYGLLLPEFVRQKPPRFNFVEREEAAFGKLLQELKISDKGLVQVGNVVEVGKLKAAEAMLFGRAYEKDSEKLGVVLYLVDTETSALLAMADVYGEDKSDAGLRYLMEGLALKMRQQFPLVSGRVVYAESRNHFHSDAGLQAGTVLGMKLLLYREIKLESGLVIKKPLGMVARVTQVESVTARAKVVRKEEGADGKVLVGDLVIAK